VAQAGEETEIFGWRNPSRRGAKAVQRGGDLLGAWAWACVSGLSGGTANGVVSECASGV
jgi:hypothetical protein